MHVRPPVPEVERKRPNVASLPAARAAGGSAASLLRLQRTAGNRAVGALLARRGRCTCGGACHTNGLEHEEDDTHLRRAGSARLQRSVGEWFDAIGETISEGIETVEQTVESAKTKLGTIADLASFPDCPEELGAALLPLPGPDEWLDNEGLEAIRNEGEVLSRTRKPSVGDRGATPLLKHVLQSWGCEKLGRDLLPKHGSEGPFGPETQEAVKQFQLWSWLPVDGVVGPQTLAALDKYIGVRLASPTPGSEGGSTEQGKSNWSAVRVPAAHIYFGTDDASLDADDERILEAMADYVALPARGAKEITLEVVGYADKRESWSYNVRLSGARAKTVRDRLVELLEDAVNVTVTTKPKSEIERAQVGETEEKLKPFRRVDVYVVEEKFRERPPKGDCLEPTTEWEARPVNMQTFSLGVKGTIGRVVIRMKHPDSKGRRWSMTYRYSGGGVELALGWGDGLPTPVTSEDADFVGFTTTAPLSITEFAGSAKYESASAVVGVGETVEMLNIDGIEDHGAKTKPNPLKWTTKSKGVSIGIGADAWGRLVYGGRCEEVTSP